MPTTKSPSDSVKQITYLASALKAPRITEAAIRLADQARDAGWTHEDYLAAVLEREVSARNASGAELRIRAAGFPARKTIEDFDWDAQPAIRQQTGALASGGFLTASSPPATDIACCSLPRTTGSPASPTPTAPGSYPKNSPDYAVTGSSSSTYAESVIMPMCRVGRGGRLLFGGLRGQATENLSA